MKRKIEMKWLALLSGAWGLTDTATGLGLLLFPELTLRAMGVGDQGDAWAFVRFIGAFVFATGSLYLGALWYGRMRGQPEALRYAWMATGWTRLCVATATTVLIASGELERAWWPVPVADGMIGAFQAYALGSKLFPREARNEEA